MAGFEEGYKFFTESASAYTGAMLSDDYVATVNEEIDKLLKDLNSLEGFKTASKVLKGDAAEFWHTGTFNIDAALKDSQHRAFVDRSHDFASTDISTNFGDRYGLKYYSDAQASAKAQSVSIFQRYKEYQGKGGTDSLEKFLSDRGYSETDTMLSDPIYAGQIRIIPRDQLEDGTEKLRLASKKLEHLLAIFVSVFIFIMGIEILSDALSGEQTELKYVPFVAAAAFVGVAINYFMARYKIYVGEQTGSSSLIADGYHSKMDMYCSIAVLVGIVGSLFGMPDLDKISAVVAMVLLMISGYEIFTSNLSMLLHPEMEQRTDVHMGHVHGFHGNKKMIAGIAGVLTAAYLLSGIYFVGLDETGVVRRFGAVVNEKVTPGIHYRLPAPFEEVSIIKSDNVQKIEVGVQELLTGDTNLVNVNL